MPTFKSKVIGEKRMTADHHLTWHWAHHESNMRAYKCTCMPQFRVNGKPRWPAIRCVKARQSRITLPYKLAAMKHYLWRLSGCKT